jgi:hypothetical protein
MNSNVLSVREAERVKTSNNRFRSLDTNTREEIMDRERKRKEREREKDILFDESLSSRRCVKIFYSLSLSFYNRNKINV